ncbi:MAG: adenylate/guanylate cyclase domain-containing protein [Chloroflexi bacterium]|nr:MAG: adenylate/guanylate cyclase domain-containing protein [Chloroflexota bacterium]TMB72363.1 MAG: adenylate/guanylate cyclase domain-containing protein [Chloroflexota bacterium]TMC34746.1 MAG: adenylate/guanylate cyclase domain-containing protein [Chloroflexota bacterium]TMC58054.1 MAG: adenylate/guanylate cyclase domain-containing protein [Chloroflexota bacterium]TME36628.1 MAG: adenylate/guanylate cyclase domain-containing protein [Chloroflexota bacterium]
MAVMGLPGAGEAAQRLSPTQMVERLNHFYEIATRAVVARDGTVDKLMSDQVIAFFGTPYNDREHALRAVEAAADVIAAMEDQWGGTSLVAAAVGTGEAFVGNVGEGGTRDYTAIGQMVNSTHELLGHARPGEALLLPATYTAVSSHYPDAPIRTITIADRDEPVAARAVSVRAPAAARAGRRALATIMVLDLVNSTVIASELGDAAWRELLARHYGRMRELLAVHEGTEIDTAGDGLLATFQAPVHAVRFGEAAIDADAALGLRTRVGVHTGEVEGDQGAIRGIAVVIAARIGALADAGQIFVSNTVRDLVAGSGLGFEDRGVRSLKGVAEPRQIYSVLRSPD